MILLITIISSIILPRQDLSLFLPDKIQDYKGNESIEKYVDPGSEVPHAIREYSNGSSDLVVTLIDYQKAPIILKSTQNIWAKTKKVDDEEVMVGPIEINGYPGWQNIQKEIRLSEVSIVVKNRYLITFQCINATANEAKKLASAYNYNWLKN